MPDKQPILKIKIDNKENVELFEFATSMASLNSQYHRFANQNQTSSKEKSQCKLLVNRVSDGSIILELCEKTIETLPIITPLIIEYSSFLTMSLDYLCGKSTKLPPYKYAKEDYLNFKRIVEIIANISGNKITFQGIHFAPTLVINNSYNYVDANAIQNRCDKEIKRLEQSGDSLIKENVSLDLYQARDSVLSSSTQGNLGIISEISDKPKVLSFVNDRLRYDITKAEQNPLNFVFSVDIEIKLREGSMILNSHKDIKEYEILKLHGPIKKADLFNHDDDPSENL